MELSHSSPVLITPEVTEENAERDCRAANRTETTALNRVTHEIVAFRRAATNLQGERAPPGDLRPSTGLLGNLERTLQTGTGDARWRRRRKWCFDRLRTRSAMERFTRARLPRVPPEILHEGKAKIPLLYA